MGGNHKELEVGTRRIDCEVCRLFAFVSAIVGSSSSRVDRSFVKHGADVKIMDSFFRHRELPDSENFSKPGFQLKTA